MKIFQHDFKIELVVCRHVVEKKGGHYAAVCNHAETLTLRIQSFPLARHAVRYARPTNPTHH